MAHGRSSTLARQPSDLLSRDSARLVIAELWVEENLAQYGESGSVPPARVAHRSGVAGEAVDAASPSGCGAQRTGADGHMPGLMFHMEQFPVVLGKSARVLTPTLFGYEDP